MIPLPARPDARRRAALGLAPLLALAVLAAGCGESGGGGASSAKRAPQRAVTITTETIARKPLVYRVQGIGSLEAYEVVVVPAKVEGTLDSLSFEEGQDIGTDKVLAVVDGVRRALEVDAAQATLSRLEAAVGNTSAQIASAEASKDEAQANLGRRQRMRAQNPGLVSDEEMAGFEAQLARLKAGVEQATAAKTEALAAVEEGRAKLALAKRDQTDAEIRPPIAGRVERKHVTAGQRVKAGDAIATIVDVRRLRLRFRVTTAESVRLVRGEPATFRTPALPGRTSKATLVHVSAAADPQTRMVECLADVVDPDPALKPGFFANVEVETGGGKTAIVVPEESVLPTEDGAVVFVVEDGKARRRLPTLGLKTSDGGVEVVSGLSVGETLVVRGANALDEGSPVTVLAAPAGAMGAEAGPRGADPPAVAPSAPPAPPPTSREDRPR